MKIGVICPHCGCSNTFEVEDYEIHIGKCSGASLDKNECEKTFAYRVRRVTSEVYKLNYCDMTQHDPNMGRPPGMPSEVGEIP